VQRANPRLRRSRRYDGTWARNNTQTQIDFGHRAVHLTAEASKKIIKVGGASQRRVRVGAEALTFARSQAYYGQSARKNYWIGCSSGGKQGLKEVQAYPDEFDVSL
jgi:feruloyl esterase